ncbi:flagellar attachment zone protein 1-like [Salvia splendens]|uniref:flagellar attachment zone protein 1-like n=1 Tax=Salvia splendens TaxID=180675 RepID=UPI001C2670DA|nr:flagellar attachment zone protein 1-like [Salvia splendens]
MFKRSEKKIKAVFKMQFQATQVPQLKSKSLIVSLVPVDVGKPTVRLSKSPIVEGTCTWENPVYETVKLIKEVKSGRIREKFYYVIVSTGSSKSGFLGEVSIDFADLADAYKPVNLTLPLQTSKSGAVLHVTVQNMNGCPDSRYDEDSETPVEESCETNMDAAVFGKRTPKSPESDDLSEAASMHNGQHGSFGDAESDYNDAESRDGVKGTSLANQMKVLERKAELSDLEVQALRKQIMKETKRGQQLSEQIDCLKEERDTLKGECERLKVSAREDAFSSHTPKETENMNVLLEKVKQELQHEKHLNKKLKLHLQETEDSNSEFVLAMRDLTKKLDQKNEEISRLSSKIKALHYGAEGIAALPRMRSNELEDLERKHGHVEDVEILKQKIGSLHTEIEALKKENSEIKVQVERLTEDYDSLEAENKAIRSKFEQSVTEKMELEQSCTEFLAVENKLKLQIVNLEVENKRQARQYSESLNIIDEIEFQVENLQKELDMQAQIFQEDLEAVTELKVEQEQRAIQAEDALRKMRLSNAAATERLQEDFKRISAEMSLKVEENEKLAQKAVAEANDLLQKNEDLEGLLQKAKEELQIIKEKHERTIREHSEQNESISGGKSYQKTTRESETLQRWQSEKENLERQLDSVRKEAERFKHENVSMKSQIEQKKTKEDNLLLQMKKLRITNNEAKSHLLELEQEKESLKIEMLKLQGNLCKKEKELEKAKLQISVNSPAKEQNLKCSTTEVRKYQETIPLQISGQSNGGCDVSSLVGEVASLKERNKSMEEELKEMHDRYSEISLRFAEVEGERQQLVMALRNIKNGKKN